jgi:hypothetical protein
VLHARLSYNITMYSWFKGILDWLRRQVTLMLLARSSALYDQA